LPPERLAGFLLVWAALIALTVDALRSTRGALRRRADADDAPSDLVSTLGAEGVV